MPKQPLATATASVLPAKLQARLQTLQAIKELQQDLNVRYANPTIYAKLRLSPTTHIMPSGGITCRCNCCQAWDFGLGRDVVVAVIDIGVMLAH